MKMEMKIFLVIFLLLILITNGTSFGRKRCRKDNEQYLSNTVLYNPLLEQNETDYHYDCDSTKFGIVQKIPYLKACPCDTLEVNFSSACVRCGMCLAIADKVNQTLLAVHEMMSNYNCLNDTEVMLLLRTICDHSFQYYGLREVDGKRFISDNLPGSILVSTSADGLWERKLKDLCHYYLDEIGEVELYEQWQQWGKNDDTSSNLSNVMCRSNVNLLRDCRSMDDNEKYESFVKTYNARVKITATYDKYGKRD